MNVNSIDSKKSALAELGISVCDGTYEYVYLKNKHIQIPYNTENFLLYNTDYFIAEVCKLFQIDNMKDDYITILVKKNEYLKKLKINKVWFGDEFYLEKDKIMIKYNFDDFIDFETDLFIADVKNRFNKIDVRNNFSTFDKEEFKSLPFKSEYENEIIIDIPEMKKKIKNILMSKGYLEKV